MYLTGLHSYLSCYGLCILFLFLVLSCLCVLFVCFFSFPPLHSSLLSSFPSHSFVLPLISFSGLLHVVQNGHSMILYHSCDSLLFYFAYVLCLFCHIFHYHQQHTHDVLFILQSSLLLLPVILPLPPHQLLLLFLPLHPLHQYRHRRLRLLPQPRC